MKKISIAYEALGFFLTAIARVTITRILNLNTTQQILRTTDPTTRIAIIPDLKKALPTPYMKQLNSIRKIELP